MHNITINVDNEDVDFARIACSEGETTNIQDRYKCMVR
jgi:hypothetical protein